MRMFEGRALKANEFVNDLLWTDSWDGYTASRSFGGWGTSTPYEEAPQVNKDERSGTAQMAPAASAGQEGASPPPPELPSHAS